MMRAAILLSVCLSLASAAERLSLIVGNNMGLPGEPRLRYATEDARRLHELLSELGGVKPGRGYLLLNRSPDELERALGEMGGRAKEIRLAGGAAEVVVFYSGHASGQDLHMEGKSWPLEKLRKFLAEVDADLRITILDACHSGAFITPKGGKVGPPVRFREDNELQAKGAVVLASSSALEFSHESSTLRGSLFSHFLSTGLRGAADYNRDRTVSLWEAYNYARYNTARHLAGSGAARQNPRFDFSMAGEKDPMLTSLDRGRSRIRFENCPPGTYALYNGTLSEQWAEVDLRAGDTVDVMLPRMDFAIHRVENGVLHAASADLRYQPDWVLGPGSFRRTWLKDYRAKGGASLRIPAGLELRLRRLRQVPEQEETLLMPELGAHLYVGNHWWGARLGWVHSETRLRKRVVRTGLAAGGSLGWERYVLPRLTWVPEFRYTAFLWNEHVTKLKPPEGPITMEPIVGYSLVQSLGAELRFRWRPTSRFYLDAGAGLEAFGYAEKDGDVSGRLEWPFSIGAGFAL